MTDMVKMFEMVKKVKQSKNSDTRMRKTWLKRLKCPKSWTKMVLRWAKMFKMTKTSKTTKLFRNLLQKYTGS